MGEGRNPRPMLSYQIDDLLRMRDLRAGSAELVRSRARVQPSRGDGGPLRIDEVLMPRQAIHPHSVDRCHVPVRSGVARCDRLNSRGARQGSICQRTMPVGAAASRHS